MAIFSDRAAKLSALLERLVDAYPDDVQLIYRHFPLNSIHPNAQKSAEAAEAAGAQGTFWEYHDALYARQAEWSQLDEAAARDFFIGLTDTVGLDISRFTAELDGAVYADYVASVEQETQNLNLPGTPAVIFNDELLAGDLLPPTYFYWDAFVQLSLLEERQYDGPPPLIIDPEASYLARIEMESGVVFVIELLAQSASEAVNSFVFLPGEGWFDGVTFHRVWPSFVAQTGDPTGTGFGGPGYTLPDEIDPALSRDEPGVVAMANAGPNTSGIQWYITLGNVSRLDGDYTIFGRIVEGMDVVEAINPRDPAQDAELSPGDKIARITIEEK